MLLSHHGQYEYGSPKRPKTIEATILNYLDDLDSKINGIRAHIAKESVSTSRWTAHHRLYDRYFFKGNGMDEDLEIQTPSEEAELREMADHARPEPGPVQGQEKTEFSNQPLKALQNLNLF
jgi:3'-5' exoribonuclease